MGSATICFLDLGFFFRAERTNSPLCLTQKKCILYFPLREWCSSNTGLINPLDGKITCGYTHIFFCTLSNSSLCCCIVIILLLSSHHEEHSLEMEQSTYFPKTVGVILRSRFQDKCPGLNYRLPKEPTAKYPLQWRKSRILLICFFFFFYPVWGKWACVEEMLLYWDQDVSTRGDCFFLMTDVIVGLQFNRKNSLHTQRESLSALSDKKNCICASWTSDSWRGSTLASHRLADSISCAETRKQEAMTSAWK